MPIDRRLLFYINWPLLSVAVILFVLGVLNLYSASGYRLEDGMTVAPYFHKQMVWGFMGMVGMVVFMFFDYRHLKTLAWPLFWATMVLLVAVVFAGKTIYGAKRWLDLGS